MRSRWLQCAFLRAASLLVPGDQRAEWLAWWRSELWYIPRRRANLFCRGAFQDAFGLRRNNPSPLKRTRIHLESPRRCLAFLATLATLGVFSAACLSGLLELGPMNTHLTARDLPIGCIATLALSCLFLPGAMAVGCTPSHRYSMSLADRLRRGIFLALKIALVQPIFLCVFIVWLLIARAAPFAWYGICAACIMVLRWVFTDQRRRCPACLQLLTDPVRIGTPSRTFLEWYGAESMCSRGHGLLHAPEISSSYAGERQWIDLDPSWNDLFSEIEGMRRG